MFWTKYITNIVLEICSGQNLSMKINKVWRYAPDISIEICSGQNSSMKINKGQ